MVICGCQTLPMSHLAELMQSMIDKAYLFFASNSDWTILACCHSQSCLIGTPRSPSSYAFSQHLFSGHSPLHLLQDKTKEEEAVVEASMAGEGAASGESIYS